MDSEVREGSTRSSGARAYSITRRDHSTTSLFLIDHLSRFHNRNSYHVHTIQVTNAAAENSEHNNKKSTRLKFEKKKSRSPFTEKLQLEKISSSISRLQLASVKGADPYYPVLAQL
jgi:hypothetical protein